MEEKKRKLAVVAVYAIAMAFLEAVVVIYLRKLFYPSGFSFPIRGFISPEILKIEIIREFFTIVMLASVAYLAGKKFYERLAFFLYSFAVWDIFYYVWLKTIINWPASFLTWDLLFLIPTPWIGPVIVPIILSITMIMLSFVIINLDYKRHKIKLVKEWILLFSGSLIILYTSLYDYAKLIIENKSQELSKLIGSYIPSSYNWPFFIIGEILIIIAIFLIYVKQTKKQS